VEHQQDADDDGEDDERGARVSGHGQISRVAVKIAAAGRTGGAQRNGRRLNRA
jgi:hypothetical protein